MDTRVYAGLPTVCVENLCDLQKLTFICQKTKNVPDKEDFEIRESHSESVRLGRSVYITKFLQNSSK